MGLLADFKVRHPHLYTCSVCEAKVCVTPMEGAAPVIVRTCGHEGKTVYANRAVTLYDRASMNVQAKVAAKVKLTLRQLLSRLLGRSI